MKRFLRTTLVMALMAAMMVGTAIPSYAASNDEVCMNSNENAADAVTPRSMAITTSWKTIYSVSTSSATGINRNISMWANTTSLTSTGARVACDLKMLNRNGQRVWLGEGVVPGNSSTVSFWCGSDVYTVQIKTRGGTGTAFAW